jgi:hypothetical protein
MEGINETEQQAEESGQGEKEKEARIAELIEELNRMLESIVDNVEKCTRLSYDEDLPIQHSAQHSNDIDVWMVAYIGFGSEFFVQKIDFDKDTERQKSYFKRESEENNDGASTKAALFWVKTNFYLDEALSSYNEITLKIAQLEGDPIQDDSIICDVMDTVQNKEMFNRRVIITKAKKLIASTLDSGDLEPSHKMALEDLLLNTNIFCEDVGVMGKCLGDRTFVDTLIQRVRNEKDPFDFTHHVLWNELEQYKKD